MVTAAPVPIKKALRLIRVLHTLKKRSRDKGLVRWRRPRIARMRKIEIKHGFGGLQRGQHRTDDWHLETTRQLALDAHEGHAHAAHHEHIGAIIDAAPCGVDNSVPCRIVAAREIDDRDADPANARKAIGKALCPEPWTRALDAAVE